jgi:hypothetical protein
MVLARRSRYSPGGSWLANLRGVGCLHRRIRLPQSGKMGDNQPPKESGSHIGAGRGLTGVLVLGDGGWTHGIVFSDFTAQKGQRE